MTYQETISYLYNSIPVFQQVGKDAYKEGLTNTLLLDEHFGHPHASYKTVHIAGTNGKGSCAHTIAGILQSSGLRVGLYTSPHLMDFRERIRVNGEMISERYVIDFVEQERSFFEPLHPSFFELTTALAFRYFKEAKVDIAVIEVGLGGRLDCTNIISPILSVITNISFDHMQFLGHTLAAIAGEKAGIMKTGIPVVIGETTTETLPVFKNKAMEMGSPIVWAEQEQQILASEPDDERCGRKYQTKDFGTLYGELGGLCQEKNTNTILQAVKCLRQSGLSISDKCVKYGFSHVCELTGLMGRWQKISAHPTVICDTGHNEGGFSYLSRQLKSQICRQLHIIIGMVEDKDINAVFQQLPTNARYYFTKAQIKRSLDEHQLQTIGNRYSLKGDTYPSVVEAYKTAMLKSTPDDFIYIGGSSYVVADFLSYLHRK